ncbi:MAG: RHS repeat-associated core domain-containing protein [Candidatus Contendobacter sp.]|nr:RHS repeat-associated core domain-containing protein [Candidatus Contendobacter sp.]
MTQELRPMLRIVGLLLLFLAGILTGAARADVITYFHNDISGSPVAATDESGRLLWKETYRPYGERLLNGAGPDANQLWFTGKPQDPDTGLSYLGARYYSPPLGRFMGIDPKEVDPEDLHGFNRYAYANNNPYKFVDPDGSHPILVALAYFALRYAVVYSEELLVAAIITAEVAGGAPTPLSAGTSAVASEVRAIKGAESAANNANLARQVADAAERYPMQWKRTVSVVDTVEGPKVVGGGATDLDIAQVAKAESLGLTVAPPMPGVHAEPTVIQGARSLGLTPTKGVTTNNICLQCVQNDIPSLGGNVTGKKTFEINE